MCQYNCIVRIWMEREKFLLPSNNWTNLGMYLCIVTLNLYKFLDLLIGMLWVVLISYILFALLSDEWLTRGYGLVNFKWKNWFGFQLWKFENMEVFLSIFSIMPIESFMVLGGFKPSSWLLVINIMFQHVMLKGHL